MAAEEKRRDLLNDINRAQERYNQLQDIAARRGQDYSKALESQEKKIKSLANQLKQVNSVIQDKLDFYADEERSLKSISSSFSNFNKLQKQSLDISRSITYQMSEPQRDAISNTLSISRDLADLTVEDTAQIEKRVSELNTQLNLVEQLFGAESEILGVLKKQAEEAKSLSSLSKEEKEIIDLQKQAADKLKQTFQGISETIQTAAMRLLSWKGLLGGALYGAGVFVDKLSEANRELGQVGRGLGNGVGSASLLSFFFKDSVGALKELGSEFGGVEQASLKTQLQTNLIANNMGIGVGEAAKLQGSFARLNNNSTDVAADLIKSTQQFAYQNKIIPSQLMGDLANSAEEFALFGKRGGDNIIRAAGYAAKLGVNMKTLSGISEGLLDFETSITKELELGAMLGRNINLNRARALAYEGDIEGATKETLKALGGVDAFNRMDYFQKKQTADLLGTSVAELDKMVKYQEQANTLGGRLNMAFDSVTESVSALGNTFGGKLLKGAGGFLMTASQAGAQFAQMGVDVKGMASKLPLIGKLFGGAPAISPGGGIPFTSAANQMNPPTMGPQPNPAGKGGIMDSMSKINMSAVLKGAAAILILSAALFVASKAFQEFGSVTWEAVGMGLAGLAGLATIAFILGKAQGPMIQGAAAVAILGAALIPFTFAMSLIENLKIDSILAAAAGLVMFGLAAAGIGMVLPLILAGSVGIAALGASMVLFGAGLMAVGTGFSMIAAIPDMIDGMVSNIGGIMLLTASLSALAGALIAVGTAGLISIPGLVALGAIGTAVSGINSLLGLSSEESTGVEEGSLSEYNTQMLSKMDELIQVTKSAKDVYLDREKVTGLVISTSEKNSVNKFSLNNA